MPKITAYTHGQFSWTDLMAQDMAAAEQFYGQLFGWKSVHQDTHGGPPYAMFELDGHHVAGIGQMSDDMKASGMPAVWNSYVAVTDLDQATARAVELGATLTMPAMEVVDAGKMAILQDPTGVHLSLWQAYEHHGAQLAGEPGSKAWHELATRDVARAATFYGQLFGWDFSDVPSSPAPYKLIKHQGRDIGGIIQMNEQWGDMPAHWSVYFAVADTDAAAAKVQELGGKVHAPPFDTPAGRIAVVADAQGGTFYLIKLARPAS